MGQNPWEPNLASFIIMYQPPLSPESPAYYLFLMYNSSLLFELNGIFSNRVLLLKGTIYFVDPNAVDLFNKYLWRAHYALGILPGTWDTWVNKTVKIPKGTLYVVSFCAHLLTLRWILQYPLELCFPMQQPLPMC